MKKWQSMPQNYAEVLHRIAQFQEKYPDAVCSFAHIVLDDHNLDDHCIAYCLEDQQIDRWMTLRTAQLLREGLEEEYALPYFQKELEKTKTATIRFLKWLLTIPENIRDADDEEAGFQGESEA